MADDYRTENDALIELARIASADVRIVPGALHLQDVILPPDHEHHLIDLEAYQPVPRRTRARVELHEAESFSRYVVRHKDEAATVLYADLNSASVVAVLNDSASDLPGWGDHRATLKLRETQPWQHWAEFDGKPLSQQQFALHIEKGLDEIVQPDPLEMYELAQTFNAAIGVKFQQAGRIADGRRALHWEEQIDAQAGEQGDLTIPKQFLLRVAPFEGGPAYELRARLRFQIREAKLTLTYVLVRPEDVRKLAFDDALSAIEDGTGMKALRGTPPVRPS